MTYTAAITVTFLHPVSHARDPASPHLPEWPPHPTRLYQALVAAAYETGRMPIAESALEALAAELPAFFAPAALGAASPINYVPTNFKGDHEKTAVQRPYAAPKDPRVHYYWEHLSEQHAGVLADLCPQVTHLGRATDPVLCRLDDPAELPPPQWTPDQPGELLLRTAQPGLLDRLDTHYADGRRPPTPDMTHYRQTGRTPASGPWSDLILLRPKSPVDVRHTSRITEALRIAVLANAGDDAPDILHGHGTAEFQPRAAWLALPHVGHRHADGHLMRVGLALPKNITPSQRARLIEPLLKTGYLRFNDRPLYLLAAESNLTPWTGSADTWASVSPTVLGRHPRRGLKAEHLIADDLEKRGYPRPLDVSFNRRPHWARLPDSGAYRLRRPGRLYGHAVIRFERPVTGPVITGAEAHFGMGLMRAVNPER